MKKKLKRFIALLFAAVQVLCLSITPVDAGIKIDFDPSGYGVSGSEINSSYINIKTYNGIPTYCIEPFIYVSEEDVYETASVDDYKGLSSEVKTRIAEYSYFGYGYQGHCTGLDYVAAQYLIWLQINPSEFANVQFYTVINDVEQGDDQNGAVHEVMQRILRDVDFYHQEIAFSVSGPGTITEQTNNYVSGTGSTGDVFTIVDSNNVLAKMQMNRNEFGDDLERDGSSLKIKLSRDTIGDRTAEFSLSNQELGYRPILLLDGVGRAQKLTVKGDIPKLTKTASIRFHTTASTDFTKVDENGNAVIGAVLQLRDVNEDSIVDTWTTDGTPHTSLGLEGDHVYELRENDAPLGYYYASTQTFAPKNTNEVQLIDKQIRITLEKVNEKGEPLAGALMELRDETDHRSIQYVSDGKPYDCSDFVTADHQYSLHELKAPAGYYISRPETFTIPHESSGEPIKIVMKDERIEYFIYKKNELGKPVAGADLSLFDVSGNEKKLLASWVTKTDPVDISEYLEAGHAYCIVENDVSTKYFLAVDENFTVSTYHDNQEKTVIDIIDSHIQYQLAKIDENGMPVKDARLTVTDITDPLDDDRIVIDWHTTEQPLIVNCFERGHTYLLRETETPDGFYTAEEKRFKIPDRGSSEPITITCVDEHTVVKIKKVDEEGTSVEGAQLTLYEVHDGVEKMVRTFQSEEGPITVYGLNSDTDYVLKETMTPIGYYPSEDITFTIPKTGNGTPIEIEMTDISIRFELQKLDVNGEHLSGAQLEVTDLSAHEFIGLYDMEGMGIEIGRQLTAGHTYQVHEFAAPSGYYFAEDIEFTVPKLYDPSFIVQLAVEDEPIHVQALKVNENNEPVKGAHLELYQADTLITEWITDAGPFDLSTYVQADTSYTIKEAEAPAGYYVSDDISFQTNKYPGNEEIQMIQIVDDTIQYEIVKVDESENPVSGVTLRLTEETEDGEILIREWISDNKPEKFGEELQAGHTYTLEEIENVAGYQRAESLMFTLDLHGNGRTVIVALIDETNAVSFLKTDESGSPLADAEMSILDLEGNTIAVFVTDGSLSGTAFDRSGIAVSQLLIGGKTYILHENKAPAGYELCDDIQFVMSGTLECPQIIQAVDRAKTMFLHVDKRAQEGSMAFLPDCEVTVYNAKTHEAALDHTGAAAVAVTNEEGHASFKLPYTNDGYYVKETRAPSGYYVNSEVQHLEMAQEAYYHSDTPQKVLIVDEKQVDTGAGMTNHFALAMLVCAAGILFLKLCHEKA